MDITDEDIPEPDILTEEEDREMKENLAQRNFGMSLAEFTKAWLAGEASSMTGSLAMVPSMLPTIVRAV